MNIVAKNGPDYRLGMYNSVGTNYATHCEAYQMRIYPNLAANNITLLTYSGSAVIDNVTSSAPQALLSGSHHYTFIVNYVLSKTAPVVQAYADGVLLAQITASPGGGFHPTGTDGAAVRIMAQCEFAGYPGTSGANVELDNVRLTAVPVSALGVPGLTQGPGATVLKDGSPYRGIGLIPSRFWFIATVPDLVGEHCNQWGNPNSATVAFMRQYVQDVVTRYQASPAIWAWEFGNECNSYADFPLALAPNYRPHVSVAGGSPAARTAEDDLTTSMLATAYNLFATEVRKYDYVRLITNGANYPRYTAYGFYSTYPTNTSRTWLTNTPAQLQTIMGLLAPDPVNLISVHCYNGTGDGWQNMTTASLAAAANAATTLGKPLYVGEFQVAPSNTPAAIQPFRDFVAALDQYNVPLASTWGFDLAQQETDWSVSGTNARCWVLNELNTWHMLHDSSVPAAVKNLYDPQVVANSLVSQGDTARLQRVFAKAMSGGTITIAALGGSITQGAKATSLANGYAQQVATWWTTKFPKATIKLVNAGIGSTGSNYGSLRVKGDVLDHHPDLVLLDFAVNDVAGVESAQSYAGVLRQLLNDPGQPAVALLFMTRNDGICAQSQQAAIGSHYNLPMVSYRDAVWPLVLGSQIPWETVGADYIHPNDVGHAYAAYLVTQMFEKSGYTLQPRLQQYLQMKKP